MPETTDGEGQAPMAPRTSAAEDASEPVILSDIPVRAVQPTTPSTPISDDAGSDAQVFSIDSALRLVAERTDRSTLYSKALGRLNDGGRACVQRMEAQLFGQRRRASDCACEGLHLPSSVFKCAEGQIWYHFSPLLRRFILSFFHIDGRDGGLPLPRPVVPVGGVCREFEEDWIDGIAARLAGSVRQHAAYRTDVDLVALLERATDARSEEPVDDAQGVVGDIVRTHCIMVLHDRSVKLPRWSVLSKWAQVHEQLESPFARAIFVGEVTCRLGTEVATGPHGRAMRLGPVGGWAGTVRTSGLAPLLLDESRAILDAIRDNAFNDALRRGSSHFLTASFMDADLMADDRRLALVRSELIYRLAMALAPSSTKRLSAPRSRRRLAQVGQDALMRRYALLSEFIRMSGGFFGRSTIKPDLGVLQEMADCRQRGRPLATSVARSLLDFGSSALFVVELFSGPSDSDWDAVDGLDMKAMHTRLSDILSEILSPQTSAS